MSLTKSYPSRTYVSDAVVIHKTKLSESDLILDLLTPDGTIIRAVAKSARKPGNTFSNRLDLLNVAHVCIAKTKNLHIIREAKLCTSFENLRDDFFAFSRASLVMELLWRLSFHGQVSPVMWEFILKTLTLMNDNIFATKELSITAAFKMLSIEGFRPQLSICSHCGNLLSCDLDRTAFSPSEGGILCADCASENNSFEVSLESVCVLRWMISSTYEEVLNNINLVHGKVYELAKILKWWVRYHIGCNLLSLQLAIH